MSNSEFKVDTPISNSHLDVHVPEQKEYHAIQAVERVEEAYLIDERVQQSSNKRKLEPKREPSHFFILFVILMNTLVRLWK